MTGPDGSLFDIKAVDHKPGRHPDGRPGVQEGPDYEKPGDANKDNVYEVTVVVTDSDGMKAMRYVTVKVMNMDGGRDDNPVVAAAEGGSAFHGRASPTRTAT